MAKTQFNYTGANQIFTVPAGVYYLTIKVWGAGGGYSGFGQGGSGCGGYSTGTMFVTPGQTFDVMVGGRGLGLQSGINPVYGGGGIGGLCPGGGQGSSGGGRSGVAYTGQSQFIIAGGGGGGPNNVAFSTTFAGNGGDDVGTDVVLAAGTLSPAVVLATGGSQSAGGLGATTSRTSLNGFDGTSLQGGKGGPDPTGTNGGGAGGGGGYFGGGGGNACFNLRQPDETPGGGGSGYVDNTVLLTSSMQSTPTATVKQLLLPPNSTDPDYVGNAGAGGNTSVAGLVVFNYTPLTITKTVDKAAAAVGDTLTYTLVYNGDSLIYNNAFFYDTIPSNTSYVTDSLAVDGVVQSGQSPNPPGISLGSIGPGSKTITFKVKVTSFPVAPYTIPNAGNIFATSVPNVTSNTISTTIQGASLTGIKSVSKTTASIGDILTYTIPVTNNGNTTASNILFIDTIPNGTTLIAGSLKQGITAISGSPNPPGVVLPSSVKGGATSIVTFQVRVTAIPNPNPIPNTASLTYSYLVGTTTIASATNTNTVNTSINFASLSGITKYVDKSFADCGDTITYTIVAPNSGTVTAQNVVFKDTIPNGTVFVPSSVFVNGVNQINSFPSSGITLPNIGPGNTATLTFQVQVQC